MPLAAFPNVHFMKINRLSFFLLAGGIALFACKREPQKPLAEASPAESPEEVVRLYQFYLDQNLFEEAKKWSTAKEGERLDEISRIVAEEHQDSTRMISEFLKLSCNIQGDSARCACKIKDQFETYEYEFLLVRINGRWLIDAAPEEEILFDEEEIEGFLDSLMEEIE